MQDMCVRWCAHGWSWVRVYVCFGGYRLLLRRRGLCYSLPPQFNDGPALHWQHTPPFFFFFFFHLKFHRCVRAAQWQHVSIPALNLPAPSKPPLLSCKLACWDYRFTHLERVFCGLKSLLKTFFALCHWEKRRHFHKNLKEKKKAWAFVLSILWGRNTVTPRMNCCVYFYIPFFEFL